QSGRRAGRAAGPLPAGHQPQGGEGARLRSAGRPGAARRRGDRVKRRAFVSRAAGAAQHERSDVVRCRPGTVTSCEHGTVPDQRCTTRAAHSRCTASGTRGTGRRAFITLLGAALAWPLVARAQQRPSKIPRIGIIDDAPIWDPFRQGLRELGYIEGQTVAFEYRSAEGKPDRLAAAASELGSLPVDVIAASGTAAAAAAKQATTTIPIVMLAIGDPVRSGLVASLARPRAAIPAH